MHSHNCTLKQLYVRRFIEGEADGSRAAHAHRSFIRADRDSLPALASRVARSLLRGAAYPLRQGHLAQAALAPPRAFERVKAARGLPHQLVLAGPDWSGAEAVRLAARESACAADIVFTGFVRSEDLADPYRGADLLVFPSLYEGFGMPLLEAMACGTPVVCSATSSLPEVAGDAALLFDPADEAAIAEAIRRVAEGPDVARELSARGLARAGCFSWERAAVDTLAVLRRAAAEGRQ